MLQNQLFHAGAIKGDHMTNWMYFIYYAALGILMFTLILPKPMNTRKYFNFVQVLGYDNVRKEAESAGWKLSKREFIAIVLLSIVIVGFISVLTSNYFFIALGIVLCFTLPRTIVLKVKRRLRMNVLFDLPSNLRMFIAKLADFGNVQKALEAALPEMRGVTKPVFEQTCNKLRVGLPLYRTLDEFTRELRIRKVEDFIDKLKLASVEGFHRRSLDSLKETVEEISEDITQIKELEIESKRKRMTLFLTIGMAWMMPILLSFMNSDNGNVFLNTFYGQIFIVSFAAASLFAIGKGDDYLSLNLEEL